MIKQRLLTSLLSCTALLGFSASSLADDSCSVNTDCGHGYSCEVVGASGCAWATPACPPDVMCELPAPPPDCPVVEVRACIPSTCLQDTDCSSGMHCNLAGNPAPDAPTTTPGSGNSNLVVRLGRCESKVGMDCKAATDCGQGFECAAQESCSCSGSGSTGPAMPSAGMDGGSAGSGAAPSPSMGVKAPAASSSAAARPRPASSGGAPAASSGSAGAPLPEELVAPKPPGTSSTMPAPECSCTTVNVCLPLQIPCTADDQCPSDWSCSAGMNGTVASPPAPANVPAPATMASAKPASSSAAAPQPRPAPSATPTTPVLSSTQLMPPAGKPVEDRVPPAMTSNPGVSPEVIGVCIAPGGGSGVTGATGATPPKGSPMTSNPDPTAPPRDPAAGPGAAPPAAPMASAVGKPSGTAGAENGAAKPETDTNQGVSDPGPDHGCNVASGGTRQGSPAWWLAAGLGLLAFRRRK